MTNMETEKRIKLFFTYFGGKWRIAKYYPKPRYQTIIEPFAGSAGYSLHYPYLQIKLYDLDPIICSVWSYLINVSETEILKLPENIQDIRDLKINQEAKWLIGFWLNKGSVSPRNMPSKWMRDKSRPNSFWGNEIKKRISSQLKYIRHWRIENKSWENIENEKASWFIDPPYHKSGKFYRHNKIDYEDLSLWVKNRNGQVMVCEQFGANWLSFKDFIEIKSLEGRNGSKKSKEVFYEKF